ncbi:MAG: ATP-binding protein [Clostridia bacterium]|nr:ATP-binding protein [Clostridia bacterium]
MFIINFDFYGREKELLDLDRAYNQEGFKFLVVYGRRRVGKSSLIQRFINDGIKPNISFMALEQNDKQNLEGFSEAILKKYGDGKKYLDSFVSWEHAIEYVIHKAGKEKLVLFIDEYPYLANSNNSVSSILQKYIDGPFKDTNITLILCGSSMSFMENQVLGQKSPLFGRRDMQYKIEPFDYFDSSKFFKEWDNEQRAIAYAVTGGIPQYLNKLKRYKSIAEGIKNEFLKRSGFLYEEPRNLLMQELREPSVYNSIIKMIASGSTKPNDIASRAGEETSKVSKYLLTLINLHLVKKEFPMFNKQERNGLYVVSDYMFLFWYRFVMGNNGSIESGMYEYVYEEKILPEIPEYMGHIFEDICIQYLKRENSRRKLPFIFDEIGRWWGNNQIEKSQQEIDIIASSGKNAIFCECKWKKKVGVEVLESLIKRSEIFKQFEDKYYYIFAKGSFSEQLKRISEEKKNIILITLDDLYGLEQTSKSL